MSKEKCKYWDKCYRKNKEHLAKYIHPGCSSSNLSPKTDTSVASPKPAAYGASPKPATSGTSSSSITNNQKPPRIRPLQNTQNRQSPGRGTDGGSSKIIKPLEIGHRMKRPVKSPAELEETGERKRRRLTPPISSDRWYFTKVAGHPNKYSEGLAVTFGDLLTLDGKLKCSWQFSFMADVDWLMEEYDAFAPNSKIILFLGKNEAITAKENFDKAKLKTVFKEKYKDIKIVPVNLPIAFGTHHTKMMVLEFESTVRIVVHTANLLFDDWNTKTQGVWVSPACTSKSNQDLGSFQRYLLKYLESYNLQQTRELCGFISQWDMSHFKHVELVGSVPGSHTDNTFGYRRLKHLLSESVDGDVVKAGWRIVANCSSIGSLGSSSDAWLDKFLAALQSTNQSILSRKALFQLVFPSSEMIRNSLEGYIGGGSVPYSIRTHLKQPWLKQHFCHWGSKEWGRSRVVPHIKTYCRLSPDLTQISWFLLTSANLSKAAWGSENKAQSNLLIRSYELGVLFVKDSPWDLYNTYNESGMLLPYSLPPQSYSKTDKPWICDISYDQLDTHGNKWPITDSLH